LQPLIDNSNEIHNEQNATNSPIVESQSNEAHATFTFYEEVDELFKEQKVRYTAEEPKHISLFDILRVVGGHSNPSVKWVWLQQHHAEVVRNFRTLQFRGSGERPAPVCFVKQMIEIINLLPGECAARFRSAAAKVLVRVLGGDDTLIDEIRQNANKLHEIETKPEHPMNIFQLPDGMSGVNAVCSLFLSPSMKGLTVADFRRACCYILLFKHGDKMAMKFGSSRKFIQRLREHNRTYPDMMLWCAIDCKFIECAEQTEQLFKGKMMAYLQTVQVGGRNVTEVLLNVTPEEDEQQMSLISQSCL
jgi:hypothetical protein